MEKIEFDKPTLILASNSPRRARKFSEVGLNFVQMVSEVDDSALNDDFAHDGVSKRQEKQYAKSMALAKIQPFIGKVKNGAVVTADTTVLCEGRVLEKPITKEKCRENHEFISGKTAYTHNAMAVYYNGRTLCMVEIIKVKFAKIPSDVIDRICDEPETLDMAGYNRRGIVKEYVTNNARTSMGISIPHVIKMLKKLKFPIDAIQAGKK